MRVLKHGKPLQYSFERGLAAGTSACVVRRDAHVRGQTPAMGFMGDVLRRFI
jgi:hypothetical protein